MLNVERQKRWFDSHFSRLFGSCAAERRIEPNSHSLRFWEDNVPRLSTLEAEQENMAMYGWLLAATAEPDVRRVLENLQAASRDRHLPAFERCLARQAER